MTRAAAGALALVAVAAAGCGGEHAGAATPPPKPIAVTTAPAHDEPLAVLYRTSGTVRGRTTVAVTSKTVGYVREVRVRAGDHVTAGQPLVVLEANDVRAGVARARAELEHAVELRLEAASAIDAAKASAGLASTTRDRMAKLLDSGAVPRQQFDDADGQWRTAAAQQAMAEARLRAASSGVDAARAALAEAQATLGYATVTAPFDGRVVERHVEPGGLASPGTPLLVVDDEVSLRVEAAVEESRGAAIHVGDAATVEIGDPAVTFDGTVGEIVPNIDVGSRAFLVKIDLPPGTAAIRPGTFARVGFRIGARPHLVVPTSAITASGALDRVFVADAGIARLRLITRGAAQGPWTEVLSGLDAGDPVIVAPPRGLRDGSPVQVGK